MKNFRIIAAALALFTLGSLSFADTAAESYLSQFTTLVTSAESCAKNSDVSKITEIASKKTAIDALRQTVTLSTMQRFSDWRLTKRYDSAYAKLETIQKAQGAATTASDAKSKIGTEVEEAASGVTGAIKESASNAASSVKESASEAVSSVKNNAKSKVEETVGGAKSKVEEAASGVTEGATDAIQKGAEGVANKINELFGGNKSE